MRQWEIYDFPFPTSENPHPCIVISPDRIAENPDIDSVHIFPCTSLRGRDQIKGNEVRLNGSDGLDGPTVVKCQWMPIIRKALAGQRRGKVSPARQRAIQIKFREIFGFQAT